MPHIHTPGALVGVATERKRKQHITMFQLRSIRNIILKETNKTYKQNLYKSKQTKKQNNLKKPPKEEFQKTSLFIFLQTKTLFSIGQTKILWLRLSQAGRPIYRFFCSTAYDCKPWEAEQAAERAARSLRCGEFPFFWL